MIAVAARVGDEGREPSDIPEKGPIVVESISLRERRTSWDHEGYAGHENVVRLASGARMSASVCRWDRPRTIVVEHPPAGLDFCVSRGPGVRGTTEHGEAIVFGGGTYRVGMVRRTVRMRFDAECDAADEAVCLGIDEARLRELMGGTTLPASLRRIIASPSAIPSASGTMSPALFQRLDEILYCDARGASRQLYLEAKGVELLAEIVDRMEEAEHAASPRLSADEMDRLQRARSALLARLAAPPSLAELARATGLHQAKLEAGFRALFGASVFAYLRRLRMDEAHRLLRARRHNVTEVAMRVGYANPSKFAAAFRRQFGVCPSSIT